MIDTVLTEWKKSLTGLLAQPFFTRMREGRLTLEHYKALMREIYYNTRENPQSFGLMAWHLQGKKRDLCKGIYRHCSAEFGHHDLALDDLKTLGVDVTTIPAARALPTTEALIAFAVYQIEHANPLAYLGYVYHLEMLPATLGPELIKDFRRMGVPENAMTFLTEHAHADQGHTRWFEDYLKTAVESDDDLAAVIYGAKGTCRLHGVMLQGILDDVAGV
jgi:pyrroloquinoline quinone (PQQ) biosynthesis protein C